MAEELSKIFSSMQVPLCVKEDAQKGKHCVATKTVKGSTTLFEEAPIVSWSFSSRPLGSFCDFCLASLDQPRFSSSGNKKENQKIPCPESKNTDEKSRCSAVYCSEECMSKDQNMHFFLCGKPLNIIRDFDAAQLKKTKSDASSASGVEEEEGGLPITLEALARSVATVAVRYYAISQQYLQQQQQQNENEGQKKNEIPPPPEEIFPLAAKMFNRLVSAPEGAEYEEIDAKKWFSALRTAMSEPLLSALGSKQVVDALLKDDTLNTMIGQLALNSQALNLPVVVKEEEEQEESSSSSAQKNKKTQKIIRPSCGAAVFALHSSLNHSCDPNAFVQFSDDHDIAVKLKKTVHEGDEITITYIPELYLKLEKYKQRRERLRNYFFKCSCEACMKEEREDQEQKKSGEEEEEEMKAPKNKAAAAAASSKKKKKKLDENEDEDEVI